MADGGNDRFQMLSPAGDLELRIDDTIEVFRPTFELLATAQRPNGRFPCLSDLALGADDAISVVDCNLRIVAACRLHPVSDALNPGRQDNATTGVASPAPISRTTAASASISSRVVA